jgi:hypothetical protein
VAPYARTTHTDTYADLLRGGVAPNALHPVNAGDVVALLRPHNRADFVGLAPDVLAVAERAIGGNNAGRVIATAAAMAQIATAAAEFPMLAPILSEAVAFGAGMRDARQSQVTGDSLSSPAVQPATMSSSAPTVCMPYAAMTTAMVAMNSTPLPLLTPVERKKALLAALNAATAAGHAVPTTKQYTAIVQLLQRYSCFAEAGVLLPVQVAPERAWGEDAALTEATAALGLDRNGAGPQLRLVDNFDFASFDTATAVGVEDIWCNTE